MTLNIWVSLGLTGVIFAVITMAYFVGVEVGKAERDGFRIKV